MPKTLEDLLSQIKFIDSIGVITNHEFVYAMGVCRICGEYQEGHYWS